MLIKKYFFKSKNCEKNKIMIWGIHYFITKLKTKIDVIPRSCFKNDIVSIFACFQLESRKI